MIEEYIIIKKSDIQNRVEELRKESETPKIYDNVTREKLYFASCEIEELLSLQSVESKDESINFAKWVYKNNYKMSDLYSEYKRDGGEYITNYDTFVLNGWSTFTSEEIAAIMGDNDNTELDFCLKTFKTSDELLELYLKEKS